MSMQYDRITVRADDLSGKEAHVYENTVVSMLRSFDSIPSTRAIMTGIRNTKKDILIVPYEGSRGMCNAVAQSDWGMFGTKIRYSPFIYVESGDCFETGVAGNSPHEVLCHELVHAMRYAAGTNHKHATKKQEERIAIMVTNIFSSETHRRLRRRHDDHILLDDPVKSTSAGFYVANKKMIELFAGEHNAVTYQLGLVKATFNPLREHYFFKGIMRRD